MSLDTKAALSWSEQKAQLTAPPFKRYMAFAYPQYYPSGGMSDFVGSFDDMFEAKKYVVKEYEDWDYDILDTVGGNTVDP